MNVKYFLVVFTSLFFEYCTLDSQHTFSRISGQPPQAISIPDTNSTLSDLFQMESYVFLDAAVAIGSISKLLFLDGRYYIGDFKNTKDVYCFDAQGRFLWQCFLPKLSAYEDIMDFIIDQDSKHLIITKGQRFYVFNANGELLSKQKQQLGAYEYVQKMGYSGKQGFCVLSQDNQQETGQKLYLLDTNLDKVSEDILITSNCPKRINSISNLNFQNASGSAMFSSFLNDTIFQVQEAGIIPAFVLKSLWTATASLPTTLDWEAIKNDADQKGLFIGPDLIYETEQSLHVGLLKGGYFSSLYYDKNSQTSRIINKLSDDIFGGFFGHIPYAILPGDRYIFIVEPFMLHKKPYSGNNPQLQEMYQRTTWDSNPILIIAKYKPTQKI